MRKRNLGKTEKDEETSLLDDRNSGSTKGKRRL
jgi:hypothetical protein